MAWFEYLKKSYAKVIRAGAKPLLAGYEKVTGKETYLMTEEEILESTVGQVLSTAAAVTAIPLVAYSAVKLIPKLFVKAPVTTLAVGGIAVTSPELIEMAGKGIFEGGMAVGEGYEKAQETGEEYGLGEAAVTGGLAAAAVLGLATIPDIITKGKEVLETAPSFPMEPEPEKQLIEEKEVGIEGEVPITPEVTTITTGKRRYKRRRPTKMPSVRQSVKIDINTRSTSRITNKYLKAIPC